MGRAPNDGKVCVTYILIFSNGVKVMLISPEMQLNHSIRDTLQNTFNDEPLNRFIIKWILQGNSFSLNFYCRIREPSRFCSKIVMVHSLQFAVRVAQFAKFAHYTSSLTVMTKR